MSEPVSEYLDPASGERHPLDVPRWRGSAGGPLLITPSAGIGPGDIDSSLRSIWRYRAAFPLEVADPISLGEGCTPLVQQEWGGARPHFKLEWFSPTGSFKDRGASVMLSALRQQGVREVIEDSSGNGGAAVAAYGAAGRIGVTVFAPASTSPAKLVQARAYGAAVELVEGPREASQTAAIEAAERGRGFYASHNWQAYFLEGTKTLAYEIWEDLGFRAPDCVVMPVGAGSSLLGCAFGFRELQRAGHIDRLPRLYAAQPLHCSPVDEAFHVKPRTSAPRSATPATAGTSVTAGTSAASATQASQAAPATQAIQATSAASSEADRFDRLERPVLPTIAEGAAIRRPLRLGTIVEALRESGGGTAAVPESRIAAAFEALAARGLFAEPTSAVASAGYADLVSRGEIGATETAVVLLTGSGLKAPRAV